MAKYFQIPELLHFCPSLNAGAQSPLKHCRASLPESISSINHFLDPL